MIPEAEQVTIKITVTTTMHSNTNNTQDYFYQAHAGALPCLVLERALLHIVQTQGIDIHHTRLHVAKSSTMGRNIVKLDNLLSIPILQPSTESSEYLDPCPDNTWRIHSNAKGEELTLEMREEPTFWREGRWSISARVRGQILEYEKKHWVI